MIRAVLVFLLAFFFHTYLGAEIKYQSDDLPSFISPLKWGMSLEEMTAEADGFKVEANNYNARYFGKNIRVDAYIFSRSAMPLFGDAQIYIESFEGRQIGIRIDTTDLHPKCWTGGDDVTACRSDSRDRLYETYIAIKTELEKSYGPGIENGTFCDCNPSVEWHARDGFLMLFLSRGELDGWAVGLWAARR